MDDNVVIDQFVADTVGLPIVKELMEAARNGHLCIQGFEKGARKLEGHEEWFAEPVGQWGDLVYLQRCWVMESRLVRELKRLLIDVRPVDVLSCKGLNQNQQEAIKKALKSSIFCLSGGPGTGKTHTIAELIRQYGSDVVVAAPTGKAVSQLKKRLGDVRAGTLHALLGIQGVKDVIWGGKKIDAKMVVVDECSMIDVGMWGALLHAIKEGTHLLLVGDHDQLPPVEVGTVYGEICRWVGKERHVHLDVCIRSDQVKILSMAEKVKRGEVIESQTLQKFDIRDWVRQFEKKNFRILSCMRKGPYGVDAINQAAIEVFRKEYSGGEWCIPVIATRTSYEHEICNGEMGILVKKSASDRLEVEDVVYFGKKSVPAVLLPGFDLAYAISVHKSQGSEYDHVVLLVPPGSEVFGKEVLYTGITRARLSLEVYGDPETLRLCIERSAKKLSGIRRKLECLSI